MLVCNGKSHGPSLSQNSPSHVSYLRHALLQSVTTQSALVRSIKYLSQDPTSLSSRICTKPKAALLLLLLHRRGRGVRYRLHLRAVLHPGQERVVVVLVHVGKGVVHFAVRGLVLADRQQ